jgi:chemotaxis protein MotB
VAITGHTDSTPFRGGDSGRSNWELSADRALTSRRVLRGGGVPEDRFSQVVGKADEEPLIAENRKDPRNRRISIVLLRDHPGAATPATPAAAAPAAPAKP